MNYSTPENGHQQQSYILRCAWLVNPGELPRPNVRITVENGIVCEITDLPADEIPRAEPFAILPQFVNAHTHLEFSSLTEPLTPANPFPDWIRAVIRHRLAEGESTAENPSGASSVIAGVAESTNSGTQIIGEICTSEGRHETFASQCHQADILGVSFRELIGFTSDRIEEQKRIAAAHISGNVSDPVRPGLCPHAPYSVHPDLFDAAVDMAVAHHVPIAVHLAETKGELELLDTQSGPFVDFLKSMNLWDASVLSPSTRPLTYLQKLAKAPHAMAIHGNYFEHEEIEFLARHRNVATVYCPRTHSYFGHSAHPWQQLEAAGATVILGTDSRASNPDLSIWKELQFAAVQSKRPVWEHLHMITTAAATALGFSPERAKIQPERRFCRTIVDTAAATESQLARDLQRLPVINAPDC